MNKKTKQIGYSDETKELARYAKALGHPVRLIILKHLSNQSCCYTGDLVDILPLAQSTISQHLKELKNAGLIKGEVDSPKIMYCVNEENWKKAKLKFSTFLEEDFLDFTCC